MWDLVSPVQWILEITVFWETTPCGLVERYRISQEPVFPFFRPNKVICSHQFSHRPGNIPPVLNPLTPNDHYSGRTAPLTSKHCILYIYSTNTGTEYFKHAIYSPFFPLQNAVCFKIVTYLVPVLFTFYIQCVLKFKKIIPAPKG